MKQVLILVAFLVLANSLFYPFLISAQSEPIPLPKTLEESKGVGRDALRILPQALKNGWQETFGILRNWWGSYISPWLRLIWYKIKAPFSKEIQRRESLIRQEIKEEKTFQIISEKKPFWNRLKELIK